MVLNPETTQVHKFKIKISGEATYDDTRTYKPEEILEFNRLANGILEAHKKQLEDLFNSMTPLKMNPVINGQFSLKSVANEEDQ